MKQFEFCMMQIVGGHGSPCCRQMSNNGDVEYDGSSWFYTFEQSDKINQIETNPSVSLIFLIENMLFIHLYGIAKIIKQKSILTQRWQQNLKGWFANAVEKSGIVLLKIEAKNININTKMIRENGGYN